MRQNLPAAADLDVLYVVSRFPKVTETFLINEWWALGGRFRMHFAALLASGEEPSSANNRRLAPQVRIAAPWSPSVLRANVTALWRQPRRYAQLLAKTLIASRRSPGGPLAALLVFWQAVGLARWAQRQGIDHLHGHFVNHPTTAVWIMHHLIGTPYSFTPHANDLYRAPALLEEKVRDAEFVVTISAFDKQYIRDRVKADTPIEVIHHGIDLRQFRPRAAGSQAVRRITCVASLSAKKGQQDLLRAFASLASDFDDLRLELVGDGDERANIERLIRSVGIEDRVTLHGWLTPAEVHETLAVTDVFALPSIPLPSGRMDGIPNALKEAMASGVPVVSTPLSGIPELVEDGVSGLLVPPGDWLQLAAAIRRLLEDRDLARNLAAAGREHVLAEFDLAVEANKLADLIAQAHR